MKIDQGSNETKIPKAKAYCNCTHPTHFTGRCNKEIEAPEHKCSDCKRDHAYPETERK